MDTAQTWTVIGVLAAGFLGMMTLTSTLFLRVLRAEIGSLNVKIDGLRGEVMGEIGGLRSEMNARFEAVDARFETVNTRLNGIDRDVHFLMRRESDRS